jgi:malate dehydrogenase (oxaloacetate-decarboxylating)
MLTEQELIKKAEKPGKDAMRLHPFYKGKVEIVSKCCVRDFNDFAIWYTPGVAQPCKDIAKNPDRVYDYTNKANTVAVISDGTRVLGLGDIGPEAGLPVMEGKALLFKYLGGVDVYPLCLDTKDADEIIKVVKILQPSFGGINLEDIEQPKCFYILDRLRKEARIPVWHDDQQGTAAVTLAGLVNALKIVGKKVNEAKIAMIGAGAANVAILRVMLAAGFNSANVVMCDINGILDKNRKEFDKNDPRYEFCRTTNKENRKGGIPEAMRKMDVVIALSKPGPNTIKKEWIADMNKDPIVFVCANPIPEIWPWEAKEAGARIVATGRSDFPNQVNNSLGFPGIFRGTLDVRAKTITDEMCIAAAYELAKTAQDKGLHEDYLIPTMDEWEVFPREATAVGMKAIEQGIARIKVSREELFKMAETQIKRAREQTQILMKEGIIPKAPEE